MCIRLFFFVCRMFKIVFWFELLLCLSRFAMCWLSVCALLQLMCVCVVLFLLIILFLRFVNVCVWFVCLPLLLDVWCMCLLSCLGCFVCVFNHLFVFLLDVLNLCFLFWFIVFRIMCLSNHGLFCVLKTCVLLDVLFLVCSLFCDFVNVVCCIACLFVFMDVCVPCFVGYHVWFGLWSFFKRIMCLFVLDVLRVVFLC